MRFFSILLSLSCLFLGACSDSSKGDNKRTYEFDNATTAKKVFSNSSISCSGLQCPEAVGGLTTYTQSAGMYSVGVCTATLIGEDLLLTNKHCIPDDLQRRYLSCKGRIIFKFPTVPGHPQESIDCLNIVALSEGVTGKKNSVQPDWAVVRMIKTTNRKPIDADIGGFDNLDAITLYPVFYKLTKTADSIVARGEIRKTQCTTHRRSAISNFFFHKLAAIIGVDSCSEKIIHGNSGSGFISDEGRLVGVGSFGLGAEGDASLPEMGGTNLACINYFNQTPSIFCSFDTTGTAVMATQFYIRLYTVLNEENYQTVSSDKYVEKASPLVREGPGIKAIDVVREEETSQDPFLNSPEVQSYLSQNILEFELKNSGKCIERTAPISFSAPLLIYNVNYPKAPLEAIAAPILVEQTSVPATFNRANDKYIVVIEKQPLDSKGTEVVEKLNSTEIICMFEVNGFSGAGVLSGWESCQQAAELKFQFDDLNENFKGAARTNLFLKRTLATKVTLEIPICE